MEIKVLCFVDNELLFKLGLQDLEYKKIWNRDRNQGIGLEFNFFLMVLSLACTKQVLHVTKHKMWRHTPLGEPCCVIQYRCIQR